MKHILFFGSTYESLIRFRGQLIEEIINRGYKVSAITLKPASKIEKNIKIPKLELFFFDFSRNKIKIIEDIINFFKLRVIIKKINPNIVIAYNIKPVFYAGFLNYSKKYIFIPMITGLGYTFYADNFRSKLLKLIIII